MKILQAVKLVMSIMIVIPLVCCSQTNSQNKNTPDKKPKEFKDYWYAGEAELTRYELQQARYGEIHRGDAVLIFVTEDFDTKSQIKHENGNRDNIASVLKLNFTRKFFTGIYPYSMMSSIFSPVNGKSSLKVTTSSQEWCGHTYSQLNLKNKKYKGLLHSYFQDEGDQEFSLDAELLEDEIWTKIRIDPKSLPIGNIKIIPGTMFLRLKHLDYKVENATATLMSFTDDTLFNKPLNKYRVEYENFERILEISFETAFPYAILAWEETNKSGFGNNAKTLTTRAVRTHTVNSPYWSQNNLKDSILRKKLGLDLSNY